MRSFRTYLVGCLPILLTVLAWRANAVGLDWRPTNGPYGLPMRDLVVDANGVLYGTYITSDDAGLVRSEDGVEWRRFDFPFPNPIDTSPPRASYTVVSGETLYLWIRAHPTLHLMRSDDRGETWSLVDCPEIELTATGSTLSSYALGPSTAPGTAVGPGASSASRRSPH